jgi:hypothetical protein
VNVSIPSTDIVYVFKRRNLATTYVLAFCVLVLISVAGMFCLFSNGQPSSNDFSRLLIATRNPALDLLAKALTRDPSVPPRVRLLFGEVAMPDGEVNTAFGLPSEQEVQSLRRRH